MKRKPRVCLRTNASLQQRNIPREFVAYYKQNLHRWAQWLLESRRQTLGFIFKRNYSAEYTDLEDTANNDNGRIDFNNSSSMPSIINLATTKLRQYSSSHIARGIKFLRDSSNH